MTTATDHMAAIDRYASAIEGYARQSNLGPYRYYILGAAQNIRREAQIMTRPIIYKWPSRWKRFTLWLGQHDVAICWLVMLAFSLWMAVAIAAWARTAGGGW